MRRRTRFIIILLLVLTAAVIVYALFFMGRALETTDVSLPSPDQQSGASVSAAPGAEEAVVTRSNVQAVLAELEREENFTCTITVEDFWPGGSGSSVLQVWAGSGRLRVRGEIGGAVRNLVVEDGELSIWYDNVNGVHTMPYEGRADRWLRLLTYESILALPSEAIDDAGYELYNGYECIFCEYTDPVGGHVNRVYVTAVSGLLAGAETYDGDGELIYRAGISDLELSVPDESLFTVPES